MKNRQNFLRNRPQTQLEQTIYRKLTMRGESELQAIEFFKVGWERAHEPDFSRGRRPRSATPNPLTLNCMSASISGVLKFGQNTRHPQNPIAPECSNVHIKRLPEAVFVQKWFLSILWGAERLRRGDVVLKFQDRIFFRAKRCPRRTLSASVRVAARAML